MTKEEIKAKLSQLETQANSIVSELNTLHDAISEKHQNHLTDAIYGAHELVSGLEIAYSNFTE